jgi:hypothetical protein
MGEKLGLNPGFEFAYKMSQNDGFFLKNDKKLAQTASFCFKMTVFSFVSLSFTERAT